jgi:cell fate regulator YaaT (PSP1 superfamily)
MLGGLGSCGRELCCASFLSDFEPVSIRMAKEQNLSLNPSKISGICGRLMCCLKYESNSYEAVKRGKVGKNRNPDGESDEKDMPEGILDKDYPEEDLEAYPEL